MKFLSFKCFNGYREAVLKYECIITQFKATFLSIVFTLTLRCICHLWPQNSVVFVLVSAVFVYKSISHRIYECSYSLSHTKFTSCMSMFH
jgi:hypothetical protein